jgi:glycosyltransferase involved in cell wall biosynthesis
MMVLFASALAAVAFAYFGYPVSLICLSLLRRLAVRKAPFLPRLTFLITACNEEKRIRAKLENTLEIDYPHDLLQIMVASDGSTDATNAIVGEFASRGVELLEIRERRGKESAQKDAVAIASGEVIVFSDVATRIEPDALKKMMMNFADPTVGCVSSVDRVIGSDGKPCGEGAYVRYEMWLRGLEERVSSLVGLSGSFFAARREVCRDFSAEMQSDFRTVLNSMKLGLRGVSDPQVIGYYPDVDAPSREFARKVRTVLRGLTVFFRHLEFLNGFRYGLFSYQYFCHKLLRWLVPFFLLGALISNMVLAGSTPFFGLILFAHLLFYGIGIYGWITQSLQGVLKIPMYFLVVNAAIAVAWWQYLTGKRVVLWTPSQR